MYGFIVLLQIAYPLVVLTTIALEIQIISFAVIYGFKHGAQAMMSGEFWNVKTGGWGGGVILGEELNEKDESAV